MRDLIAKIEKLDGPDREVDAEIATSVGGYVYEKRDRDQKAWFYPLDGGWRRQLHRTFADKLPASTASLDAAVALAERVLPGWWWQSQTGTSCQYTGMATATPSPLSNQLHTTSTPSPLSSPPSQRRRSRMIKLSRAQRATVRNTPDAQRLMDKVVLDDNGCWQWKGASNMKGYGSLHFRGKTWKSHRVSYTIFIGEIPDGLIVCHHCDNTSCVNPSHLFLGHHAANVLDMLRKGRSRALITSDQSHFRSGCAPSSAAASGAKLTAEDMEEIVDQASRGIATAYLAQQYRVDRTTVQRILRGRG